MMMYRLLKPVVSSTIFRDGILKQYHCGSYVNVYGETPMWERTSTSNLPTTYEILGPGMILLRNYITIKDQVNILHTCNLWGAAAGKFYIPTYQDGEQMWPQMMCFGRNWHPMTRYEEHVRSDAPEPLALPSEFISLAEATVQAAQAHLPELPSMRPDFCIVNFYSPSFGFLGLHNDADESSDSLQRGLPVVSVSIGDSAEFVYFHAEDENRLERLRLQSGDVLIFGGKSRLIYHGVEQVFLDTAPRTLKEKYPLTLGRLNLTFRHVGDL